MANPKSMLSRIRTALEDRKQSPLPMPTIPHVWDIHEYSPTEMTKQFQNNLETVQGEFTLCNDFAHAVQQINELLNTINAQQLAVLDRPLSRKTAEQLRTFNVSQNVSQPDSPQTDTSQKRNFVFASANPADVVPEELAKLDVGLVSPEYLLADTGSCLFTAPTAFDRLTTYLMPILIVVAEKSMLRENLPAVWAEMKPKLETATNGEFVIVTGPSRTADIEKILILGVHGPKRLIVFLLP
ncbi:MAG: lactate utilization protein [Planctomycetaceae bacterium]|jgi:L-lactate dehydrogenase complex protein LldG|nr:lactate utilization protein [Planctomycetaceae bacterium]